jgi:hypothetical protein
MSSFSCPHYDDEHDMCRRVDDLCVPGRPGCVLAKNSGFAVPWEQRLEAKRRERDGELLDERAGSDQPDRPS